MCNTLADRIISLRGEVGPRKTISGNPLTFYLNVCTKEGKGAVVYMCVAGIDLACVGTVSTV